MKITLAQLNPTIGDISGNLDKLEAVLKQANEEESDLVVFSELFITGYPPRDLLERNWFIRHAEEGLNRVCEMSNAYPEQGIIIGVPLPTGETGGRGLHNSAVLIYRGKIEAVRHKTLLPVYDVFDEARYFDPAVENSVIPFKGEKIGLTVCEDAWNDPQLWSRSHYETDPVASLACEGATIFINISASPFSLGKQEIRYRLVRQHAVRSVIPFIFVNQVGANDELIFDGSSMAIDSEGKCITTLSSFSEEVITIDSGMKGREEDWTPLPEIESMHDALVLGLSDYMRKCGFGKTVVGLSGGIDSAVTVALAVKAIGAENVTGITMPSPYSSDESSDLSCELAENLGIKFESIPITDIYRAYINSLEQPLDMDEKIDVTLENIQARIRGNILMAYSNRYGHMVLSTGNKSELAVGYCTLYGDMSGGLAVISDVPKTMVYKLARYMNESGAIIPTGIIERTPSAELRPDQKDQDTLPPYEILDAILKLYIDEGASIADIAGMGIDEKTVRWVVKAVNSNEYKRRQAAPGLKITSKAFGTGRRMVIAAKYDI